jgi:hypothetical protein
MIFAVSPGSDGWGPDRYTSYLPFVLAPGAEIPSLEGSIQLGEGPLQLNLERLQSLYAVSSGPFASIEAAAIRLEEIRASLLWLSLSRRVGVSYPKALGETSLYDAPKPVPETEPLAHIGRVTGWTAIDGHYDAETAVIRPEHKRLARWETGRASLVLGLTVETFFQSLKEALSFQMLPDVIHNHKLRLAIELYAAYRFELADSAQLITLVSALESLLPELHIPETSIGALDRAKSVVREIRDAHAPESAEWPEINHLLSRIGALKTEAIGTNLRSYVRSIVSRHKDLGDPQHISTKLRDVYSIRSTLLHEGRYNDQAIGENLSFLREFVPQLLAVLFREAAGETRS